MVFIVVNNSGDLSDAQMTPRLIKFLSDLKEEVFIVSYLRDWSLVTRDDVKGIILSGGPLLLSGLTDLFQYSKNLVALVEFRDVPVLGICFGFQILASAHGGEVASLCELGKRDVIESIAVDNSTVLFEGINDNLRAYQWHSDHVSFPPPGFMVSAYGVDGVVQAIESVESKRFGVQFHPEGTEEGKGVLDNFVRFCLSEGRR